MPDIAIKTSDLKKDFKLGSGPSSLKQAFIGLFVRKSRAKAQQVLKGIDLEIHKGDFYGIVGQNGEGKSTLLKLLAGVYVPTSGEIWINGKLTPFIELGVGFNPELSGRDNVFLNGALLGFTRKQMLGIYDEIVEFAELKPYMDKKLKNYSSGMQVRLAFSIAIKAKNEILIFDEVLAVGDEAFQQKCLDVFEGYKSTGQTVILVTHDMNTVRRFCNKAALLSKGKVVYAGDPNKVATEYTRLNNIKRDDDIRMSNDRVMSKIKLTMQDNSGKKRERFITGDTLRVKMTWPAAREVKNVGLAIMKNSGEYVFGTSTLSNPPASTMGGKCTYEVELKIGPGNYHLSAGLFGDEARDVIEYLDQGPSFSVSPLTDDLNGGIARLKYNYEFTTQK